MKSNKTSTESKPIVIAIPSIIPEKMQAILSLCRAVEELARVLNSANIHAEISNTVITGAKTGIQIGGCDVSGTR